MSEELSIAEESSDYPDFNFTLCQLPELEHVIGKTPPSPLSHIVLPRPCSELQNYCRKMLAQGDEGGGGVPTYVMTVIQIFYALVCICGLVGNSLVIYVVLRWDKPPFLLPHLPSNL